MKKTLLISSLIIITLITNITYAGVLIQISDAQHQAVKIYIQDNKAHIVLANNQGHVVMDVADKTMKAVMHKYRTVWDMSEFLQDNHGNTTAKKYVDIYTKTLGLGPTIVGYETEEYALYANDNYCGSLFVSVNAMRDMGVKKFARAVANMDRNIQAKISEMTGISSDAFTKPCDEANRKTSLRLRDIGFPLKSTNRNKKLESVVTLVNKNARLPVNAFNIPSDYKTVNPSKLMDEALKNITPEMRRMIEQQMRQ